MPEAIRGYLHLIHDKHPDVVDCALFGLVHWNDPSNINAIRTVRNPRTQQFVEKAVAALRAKNPRIYSPHFVDHSGVWRVPLDDQQ
jgi:hypothetical protein